MRVAIDARWIFEELSGVGTYTTALIAQLAQTDRENEYILYFNDEGLRKRTVELTGLSEAANFTPELVPYAVFSLKNQCLLPRQLRKDRIDVYHSTNYMIPLPAFPRARPGAVRCVTTIHDVIPMVLRDHAPRSRKSRLYPVFQRLMLEIGSRADAIITVSQASRRDILRHLRIPEESAGKVHVIYNGVSPAFRPPDAVVRDATARTILYVGRSDPYKNVTTLIRAFAELLRQESAPPVRLVIIGSPDPRYPEAEDLVSELGIEEHVEWTGYIPQERLPDHFQKADVLVHPSRYEGFGLQILEAMACGTPVVCSNAASLPEVADEAAILVDPDDTAGFADGMRKVLSEPGLAAELTAKGFRQAARFSWQQAAQQTLDLYHALAGENG